MYYRIMPTKQMSTLRPHRFPGTCFFLCCLGVILLIPLSNSMGMAPPEEEIETLDTIEITGAVIEQQERTLTFPLPQIRPVDHPDPRKNLSLPKLRLHKPISALLPVMLDQTARTGNLHTPIKPLKTERPLYPRRAREQGWQGRVIVRLKVSANGTVESGTVHQSSGYNLLDDQAVKAAKQWTFEPAKNGGFPIATTVNIPIQFDLLQ